MKWIVGKYSISFLLFLTFLMFAFQFVFFMGYMQLHKAGFRTSILEKTSEHLIIKKYANNALHSSGLIDWHYSDDELTIDGEYFEVLETRCKGDSTILFLLSDETETELFKKYSKSPSKESNNLLKLLVFLIEIDFISPESGLQMANIRINARYSIQDEYWLLLEVISKDIKPPRVHWLKTS